MKEEIISLKDIRWPELENTWVNGIKNDFLENHIVFNDLAMTKAYVGGRGKESRAKVCWEAGTAWCTEVSETLAGGRAVNCGCGGGFHRAVRLTGKDFMFLQRCMRYKGTFFSVIITTNIYWMLTYQKYILTHYETNAIINSTIQKKISTQSTFLTSSETVIINDTVGIQIQTAWFNTP